MKIDNKIYKHRGNGKFYKKVQYDGLQGIPIKQDSLNEWDSSVMYYSVDDVTKVYLTGQKRFNERFISFNEDKIAR